MKFRLSLATLFTLSAGLFVSIFPKTSAAENSILGQHLLPTYARESYSASFTDRAADPKDSKSYTVYGKIFQLGWMLDSGPQTLYFALSMSDGTYMIYDTGLGRRGLSVSASIGACQDLYTGSSRQKDRGVLVSEINVTATPHTIDIFALTNFSYNEERKIADEICQYAPTHPSVRTILPSAKPFASIEL